MNKAFTLPGPRDKSALNRPHVLTIIDAGDGEKDWDIEHHPDCPVACAWFPPLEDGSPWFMEYRRRDGFPPGGYEEHGERTCLLRWELDANGIDSLCVISHRRKLKNGEYEDVPVLDDVLDPNYAPSSPWEAEWKRLRPGRYLIEAWYTPGGWAGDYYEPDAGLTLLSRCDPRAEITVAGV